MWAKLTAIYIIVLVQLVIIFTGLLLYDFGYKKYNLPRKTVKSNESRMGLVNTTASREPLILLFNQWAKYPYWGFEWESIGNSSELHLPNCPHKCRYTIDRRHYEATADMVLVNTFYLKRVKNKPNYSRKSIFENQKKTGQMWVGVTAESPSNERNFGRKDLDDVFHWVASYRRDSDIFWPYATYTKRTVPLKIETNPSRKGKSKRKLVAWLVSRCHSESKREVLVRTLQRYVSVDIYGKCSRRKFPKGAGIRAYIAQNYKFYLAFENSLCVNYVTEKLFYILNETEAIVPITYSWINDTTLAPPNSYIDASDFKSVKHLAEYLQYLDENDDEYNRYLEWKKHYRIVFRASNIKMCLACHTLLKYKERLESGGEGLKRQPSMLKRFKSLGRGANYSYVRVAGNSVKMKNACFDPFENKASKTWLLGGNV